MKPWIVLSAVLLASGCSDSSTRTETPCNEGECRPSLDLLWVIDNSQSMCQEQKIIRDNFRRIIEGLDANLDFHIAVTTTHMDSSYPLEPVAAPGLLQSTPQPVV